MTYFADLSIYTYHGSEFYRPGTECVGWLEYGYEFEKETPSESLLDLMWEYCKISVAQLRGIHECQFCPPGDWFHVERKGERLLLGTSEIRVFGRDGLIYAAPTLIYHYIATHHYKPPEEFLLALKEGPNPQSAEYFGRLEALNLSWAKTSSPTVLTRIPRQLDVP